MDLDGKNNKHYSQSVHSMHEVTVVRVVLLPIAPLGFKRVR